MPARSRKVDRYLLYASGVRRGHKVLVLGVASHELLQALAKLIGPFGQITVMSDDSTGLAAIEKAAADGAFTAVRPFSGGHPAFDFRSAAQRQTPVAVQTRFINSATLAFADQAFDGVWVAALPASLSPAALAALDDELGRVTRQRREKINPQNLYLVKVGDPLALFLAGCC